MNRTIPEGYRVRYNHLRVVVGTNGKWSRRYAIENFGEGVEFDPHGGATIAYLFDDQGNPVSEGEAYCNQKDNFCYRIGRDIARGRALKKLEEHGETVTPKAIGSGQKQLEA